ncbi:pyridoxamine 5'-phosphate oxidase family protein [Nonomuraea polychroma]|uniref:Pyridoxamine 5'-phosphate oxidase family protein n=1 Tax=Nonomuraea polychroma TaxID=46176 RepID=A0A438M054_9ACTN|nr:PPOX class F420-dependent oxidoreductase [Nonomuraea polychroma]RVX39176.1 pyridoxamine 5'-phosphate oxidase family protein [Nonomuraea polychroma]
MTFTRAELEYLATQRLGRLATVSPDGQVQNSPTGFFVDPDAGTIDIGGHDLGNSKKFKNVQAGSTVAFVVDDLASMNPWTVRGVEIRGTAEALTGQEPPFHGFSREIIRIKPNKIISWGLGGPMSNRRV